MVNRFFRRILDSSEPRKNLIGLRFFCNRGYVRSRRAARAFAKTWKLKNWQILHKINTKSPIYGTIRMIFGKSCFEENLGFLRTSKKFKWSQIFLQQNLCEIPQSSSCFCQNTETRKPANITRNRHKITNILHNFA